MQRITRRLTREIGAGEEDQTAYDSRIEQVSAQDVRDVINQYVRPEAMTIVVVAPAAMVAGPLRKFGEVKVVAASQQEE